MGSQQARWLRIWAGMFARRQVFCDPQESLFLVVDRREHEQTRARAQSQSDPMCVEWRISGFPRNGGKKGIPVRGGASARALATTPRPAAQSQSVARRPR